MTRKPASTRAVTEPTGEDFDVMTVSEAAEALRVGETTMRKLIESVPFPSTIIGGRRRVRRSDIQAYIDREFAR